VSGSVSYRVHVDGMGCWNGRKVRGSAGLAPRKISGCAGLANYVFD
jgi:hypothetical protein